MTLIARNIIEIRIKYGTLMVLMVDRNFVHHYHKYQYYYNHINVNKFKEKKISPCLNISFLVQAASSSFSLPCCKGSLL